MKAKDIILVLFSILILSGCKTPEPIIKDSITYIETITENPSYTIPDSVYWQLEFECDSNFEVLLRDFEEVNTGLETIIQIKEVVRWKEDRSKVNRLVVNLGVFTDSIASLNRTIEKLKDNQRTITVEKEVPVNHIPRYAWICIIFTLCAVIYVAVRVYLFVKAGALKGLLSR